MRLTCVVDNCVQRGSSLWGEHGLSFLIETSDGNVLWDTGQSVPVLEHNLGVLDLDETPIAAVALSHAHYDHTGALAWFLEHHRGVPVYANGKIFAERFSRRNGVSRTIGLAKDRSKLEALATFHASDEPQDVVPGIRTTGLIRCRPFPQGSGKNHRVRRGNELVTDPYADDMSLVLQTGDGIVLLCGCCHAGLRNTLSAVRSQYHQPLVAVIGGTHLTQVSDAELRMLVDALESEGIPQLYLNHCTGEQALIALAGAFGERVRPCPAGMVIEF